MNALRGLYALLCCIHEEQMNQLLELLAMVENEREFIR